jgi:hypothetical protein
MSTDRDTTRILRSWLRTDEHESADRVLDAVLERLDTTPQRRATWWTARRLPDMKSSAKLALAATAVVVVAIVGAVLVASPDVGSGDPETSASPSNTPSPSPVSFFGVPPGSVESGAYVVDSPFPARLTFTLPDGWEKIVSGREAVAACGGSSPPGTCIGFWMADNVAVDACDPSSGQAFPQVGPTVDDLAASLAANQAIESTDPAPVTVSGFDGVYLEVEAPDAESICTLAPMLYWTGGGSERSLLAGERTELWILDVDGARVVIEAAHSRGGETTEQDLSELQEIIASIEIGH